MRIEDRKGKSRAKKEDEPEYEEFSSQLSERSEGVPDIFSDTENVNKFMFAAQLMWEVAGKHVVDNNIYNNQYSQQVMYNFLSTPFNSQENKIPSEYTEDVAKRYEAKVEDATLDTASITQQTNGYDCGVHVLYVITKLMEADKERNLLEYLENGELPDSWGTTKIVANFRLKVHELFTGLLESDTQ
ncbi:hypothetical protein R1sor_004549 [Riccia sorocarpa]|uniref:Ubiquitin-like protease family profile domain-containing protein n=1 Tax=Riccia sorocarpa TaxID=122646 RepID=A0ABD3HHL9_9MARC